jgi:type VI protein secretion system component Hcp
MKKLLFLSLLICFTISASAQQMALSISGFENGDATTRVLIQSVTASEGNAYVIVKKKNVHSAKLSEAAMSKRVFSSARLMRKFPNGDINTTRLTNITISDYTESGNGASATETFTLLFEQEDQLH